MSLEEEFDGIIRQKAREAIFPFDEKNWEKAAAMLDAERKSVAVANKSYYAASIIGIVFITTLVVGFNYLPTEIKQEKITAINNIETNQTTKIFKRKDFGIQKASIVTQNASKARVKIELQSSSKSNKVVVKESSQSNPVNHTAVISKKQSFEGTEIDNKKIPKNSAADNRVPETEHLTLDQSEQIYEATELSQKNEIYMLSPIVAMFPKTNLEQEIDKLDITELKRYDDYYKKNTKRKTHYFNVEVGGVYLLGWNTKEGKDGKGSDLFGGFNYGVYLNKKISLSVGAQSYNIRNIHQASYTNEKTEYDFGVVTSNTIITSNNLYYVALPFKINYAINSGNQIALGLNAGYAIGAKNTVQTYEMQEGHIVSRATAKNTALYQNINSFNMMLTASYKVKITPRLFLNGEFIYGVSDIFKNNQNVKNQEQPIGLRFGLQFNLFDK